MSGFKLHNWTIKNPRFNIQTSNFKSKLQTSISSVKLLISNLKLQTSNFKLQASNIKPQTANFKIQAAIFKLQASSCQVVKLSGHQFAQLQILRLSANQIVRTPDSQIHRNLIKLRIWLKLVKMPGTWFKCTLNVFGVVSNGLEWFEMI